MKRVSLRDETCGVYVETLYTRTNVLVKGEKVVVITYGGESHLLI